MRFTWCVGPASSASTLLPITPSFVLPYKRYATPCLFHLAQQYVSHDQLSLRTAVQPDNMAVCYVENEADNRVLSHTTLWRWLGYLGMLTVALQTGIELFLQHAPNSTIHRFAGPVSPRKSRSEARAQILRDARRVLYLIDRWDEAFPKERFFPRCATRARAP